ncbi:unnamed protein product, partial [Staurois parvus]
MMLASDILLTTIHVITDWPISDHMIGTSHRGWIAVPGSAHRQGVLEDIYKWPPAPALLLSGRLCIWSRQEVVKVY